MNRDDIIRMAREAGFADGVVDIVGFGGFEAFADLVAAHEREKVAKWMVERGYATGHGDTVEDLLTEIDWQAAEREREGYRQGYADAMNWKTQNHLEHLFWDLFDENQRLRAEMKFNTTPPQQWVGLTDEEIKSLPSWWPSYEDAPALIQLVKDIEAKLREKNGGSHT